jgi:carbon monoxide dehydrogenase subunit G
MKIQGEQLLPLPPQAAWNLLLDHEVLARAIPGCESLVPIGPDEYEMKTKIAVSSIQGLFAGKIRIEEKRPPSSYRLVMEGQGRIGHVRGSGVLTLAAEGASTKLSYQGEAHIGGLIASVGERMLDMTAKMMTKKFFSGLLREAESAPRPQEASE